MVSEMFPGPEVNMNGVHVGLAGFLGFARKHSPPTHVEFLSKVVRLGECVATYSGRLVVARSFIGQWQWQHSSAKLLS